MNELILKLKIVISVLLTFIVGCTSTKFPSEVYNQYEYEKSYSFNEDTLKIELKNPLWSPLRVWVFNDNDSLQSVLNDLNPIVLDAQSDTIVVIPQVRNFDDRLRFSSRLGKLSKEIKPYKIELPFAKNKEYKILQGNNTNFTQNSNFSRYAIDFNLKTNDTVHSATNGYVVGVIDKYEFGGKSDKWRDYGNFITVYDPDSGIFCQYSHLVNSGSLVAIGDRVEMGQPIALSGNTGQSTVEHLHFNCLKPINNNDGLISIPVEFVNGQNGIDLKKGDVVTR